MMDHLHSLRAFVAVAEGGSFTSAAERLALSGPVTTRLISALEKRLGCRLFQRTTRCVTLTEAGALFLDRARFVVESIDMADNLAADQQGIASGVLRIATTVAFGLHNLTPLLSAYLALHPAIVPHVTLTDAAVDVIAGRFDVLITPDSLQPGATLVMRRFASSPMLMVAAPSYLARNGMPQTSRDMQGHTFLTHANDATGFGQQVIQQVANVILRPEQCITANSVEMLHRFASGGLGIALLPKYLIAAELAEGKLSMLFSERAAEPMTMNLAFASRHYVSAKVRTFVDFVVQTFAVASEPALRGQERMIPAPVSARAMASSSL